MKKPKLFSSIGLVVGSIGVSVLLNMVWVGYFDSAAKVELDKPYFLLSNGLVGLILVIVALILVRGVGRNLKIKPRSVDPEIGLRELAYRIWRRVPIRERALSEIQKKHPDVSIERISDAITKAEALILDASEEAERFRSKAVTKEQGITRLAKDHPGFPKNLYATAWGYGMQDTR